MSDTKILKLIGDFPEFRSKDSMKQLSKELGDAVLFGKDKDIEIYVKSKIKDEELPRSKIVLGNRYGDFETYDSSRSGIKKGKKFMAPNAQTQNLLSALYSVYINQVKSHTKKTKAIKDVISGLESGKSDVSSVALNVLQFHKKKDKQHSELDTDLTKYLMRITKDYVSDKTLRGHIVKAFVYFIQQVGVNVGHNMFWNKTPGNPKMFLGMSNTTLHMSLGKSFDPKTVKSIMQYVDSQIKPPQKKGSKAVDKKAPKIKGRIGSNKPTPKAKASKGKKKAADSSDSSDDSSASMGTSASSDDVSEPSSSSESSS